MNGKQAAAIALTLIIAIPILAGYAFASETTTKTQTVTENTVSLSDQLLNSDAYYYNDYTGPMNNYASMYFTNQYRFISLATPSYINTGTTETSVSVGSVTTYSLTLDPNDYVDIEILHGGSEITEWEFRSSSDTHLKITFADGSVEYFDDSYTRDIARYGGTLYIGAEFFDNIPIQTYYGISSVGVMVDNAATLSINYYAPTSTYADVADGWTADGWTNGYLNRAVVFYLHLDTPASGTNSAVFRPYSFASAYIGDEFGFNVDSDGVLTISNFNTETTTYEYRTLGTYNDAQIVYDCENKTATIAGISGWPAMGAAPSVLNMQTFDIVVESFNFIDLSVVGNVGVWRCDNAEIAAGTFPVTENYTLDMAGLFPGKEYNVKLNSIGIYGDTLTIAGTSYAVTDGTITVNNESVKLKGMEIEVVEDSGTWTTSVNGDQVASGSSAPTFTFGGVWSLTATADILKDVTVTSDEWKPGEFAFDKDNFILMLLLTAVAAFVVLGFTAGRSGGKALALIVTCGGAAVIALMMV